MSDQYDRIKRRINKWALPSERECLAILASQFDDDDAMIQHAITVANLAENIASELHEAGHTIDVNLAKVCGYLHDIGKGHQGHARYGADLLAELGFPQIGDIVATHMDLDFDEHGALTEKEVLFLADKKTSGTKVMALDERLSAKLKQLTDEPDKRAAVEKRLGTAMKIERRIESIIGGYHDNST